MRVLLINTNQKNDVLAAPPVGLSYVATAVKEKGHDVRVEDLCFQRNVYKSLKKTVQSFSPDVIGLSIRNIDNVNMLLPISYLPDIKKIVHFIKGISNAPIVLGGSAVSLNPSGLIRYLEADAIVVSDGENAFAELLKSMENGSSSSAIPGVGTLKDGAFCFQSPDIRKRRFGRSNLGDWTDFAQYSKAGALYSIQSKRGCCYRCVYCVYHMIEGRGFRLRDPEEVVDEIEEAHYKYSATDFEFVDSVLNEPFDHFMEILENICERPWKARFAANAISPRNLDNKTLDMMWRAGFRSISISPESASMVVSRNYGKSFSVDELRKAAIELNNTRITTWWFFLLGGPGETIETSQETMDFILNYLTPDKHPPYHNINMFLGVRIHPGTRLWEIAAEENMIHRKADPLQQCWYISHELDLERVVDQLLCTAERCPEIFLGFDESVLRFSKIMTVIGELTNMPKPYWRHVWGLNRLLLKAGLRFMFKPKDLISSIKAQLRAQGYSGPHLYY